MNKVYSIITDKIISALKEGTAPWQIPWRGGPPRSIHGHRYRGLNVPILNYTCSRNEYTSPIWLTWKQAAKIENPIRKGEKSTQVILWKWIRRLDAETEEEETFPILRYFNVFNTDQTTDPAQFQKEIEEHAEEHPTAEQIVSGYPNPPTLKHGGPRAYYAPATDTVTMPPMDTFYNTTGYYEVLFHELTHSTGHQTRLNRPIENHFGNQDYSKEELIAEMGGAFLCQEAGIDPPINNNAAYIQSWLQALENDHKLIVHAAAAAQKAADHILNRTYKEEATDQ